MEKFALLNLLKAIDGLNGLKSDDSDPSPAADVHREEKAEAADTAPKKTASPELPNFMYETLVRHEAMSNRLRNKR